MAEVTQMTSAPMSPPSLATVHDEIHESRQMSLVLPQPQNETLSFSCNVALLRIRALLRCHPVALSHCRTVALSHSLSRSRAFLLFSI